MCFLNPKVQLAVANKADNCAKCEKKKKKVKTKIKQFEKDSMTTMKTVLLQVVLQPQEPACVSTIKPF